MNRDELDSYCYDCGRSLGHRYGPGAHQCKECERGLIPDPQGGVLPSPEYLVALKASRLEAGLCGECGTQPNGDLLQDGLCRACVLAKSGHPDSEVFAHTARLIAAKRSKSGKRDDAA